MQRLEVSGAVLLIYRSIGVKGLRDERAYEHALTACSVHSHAEAIEREIPCMLRMPDREASAFSTHFCSVFLEDRRPEVSFASQRCHWSSQSQLLGTE